MRGLKLATMSAAVALALIISDRSATATIQAPGGGQIRALIVGIDEYPHLPPRKKLKGAMNDARDLSETLARSGVPRSNIIYLTDKSEPSSGIATRDVVIAGIKRLIAEAKAGDLIVISFAGHGTRVPEKVHGSKPDGLDEAYVLYDFDPGAKVPDLIIGPEMKNWLGQLETKGADILYIVDTCHGGGMTRGWDLRSGDFTTRAIDPLDAAAAAAALKNLKTESDPKDSLRDESSFKRVTFLAAVDKYTRAPEVDIPVGGRTVKRGALSYSVARAMEALRGARNDGTVTRNDLFADARQTVLQYAQDKQRIVTEPVAASGALNAVVWRSSQVLPPPPTPPLPVREGIGVGIVNGDASALANVPPFLTPFRFVENRSDAQLVWDSQKKEVIVKGDVIAHGINAQDIPAVVDRVRAVDELKKLSEAAPQTFELLPNNRLHRKGEHVTFRASDVQGKYLIIFNIAGDGTVQFLFPKEREKSQIDSSQWNLDDVVVQEPYGSDTVVAIASDQLLEGLESALRKLNGLRKAGLVPSLLAESLPKPPQARLGFASIFTSE